MTIEQLLKKVAEEYCFGAQDFWIEKVKSFPKNEWIVPNNSEKSEDFTMLNEMAYHNWCDKMIEPSWVNGSFTGNKISFRIKISK